MDINLLTGRIIGAAIKVHKELGPGLLESAYKECLSYELCGQGMRVYREKAQPVIYQELKLDHGYRIDLLVDNKVVIELKAVETLTEVHFAQVLTYLRLGNYPLGLLMNFNSLVLTRGIRRIVNKVK